MYQALNERNSSYNNIALGCSPATDNGSRLCHVGKGVAVMAILTGIGLLAALYNAVKRGAEIIATAERPISGAKLVPLGSQACAFVSLFGLFIMICALMRVNGKLDDMLPPAPYFEGSDTGALLLLIASVAVAYYTAEDSLNLQQNCVYSTLVSGLCAMAFWSTFIFKVRALDNSIGTVPGPCDADDQQCDARRAFAAGYGIIALSQTVWSGITITGILKPPPAAVEI